MCQHTDPGMTLKHRDFGPLGSWLLHIWCNSFAVCLLGSNELWVYDQIYVLSMKVIWVFWSLICMITYSLVFLLRIFGLVGPTRLIFLAMGRGALWWVRSRGVLSQWLKGQQGTYCIIAIEVKKMGFTSYCLSLSLYIMSSCLKRYSVLLNLINTLNAC